MARLVPCPQCREETLYSLENPYRPFCSERCRLIDLGAWGNESYRVPVPETNAGDETEFFPPLTE